MVSFTLFTLSGTILIVLTLGKRMSERRKKPFFVLKAIRKGDERVRALHLEAIKFYSEGKERAAFFTKKQLPIYAKVSLNRLLIKLREGAERYVGDIRDSRLIKKNEGISEFFKNMSEVEKGGGEINEVYVDASPEVAPEPVIIHPVLEEEVPVPVKPVKKATKRVRKSPARKKLVVTNIEENLG